jgi:hypothetical protein
MVTVTGGRIDLSIAGAAFAGPAAWFLATCVNYFFAAAMCAGGGRIAIAATSVVLIFLSLAAAALSFRFWRSIPGQSLEESTSHFPRRMLAGVGVLCGILFASVIVLQGSATVFMASCTG